MDSKTKNWQEPFQTQIEQIAVTCEQTEQTLLTAENVTTHWPDKREITLAVNKTLGDWLSKIHTLTRPFNFQELYKEKQRFINSWRNITWRHPLARQVYWGNVLLQMQIIALRVWSYRLQILIAIGTLIVFIGSIFLIILLLPLILTFIANLV